MENNNRVMITFDKKGTRFNYRVAAVMLHQGRVLLHRGENDSFWALPGGRVEVMEDAATAIVREMEEELGIRTEVERLLWIAENFFVHEGVAYHEICLYFLLGLPAGAALLQHENNFYGLEDRPINRIIFQWFPQQQAVLENAPVLPEFLSMGLVNLPEMPKHIVEISNPIQPDQVQ
jgi:ADP-ribose pyrophosphatase YjhB (NUDIX family)